ncbi:mCG148231 [Mus musculus]|nr:mCG148231 [Mus musculus]
MREAPDHSQCLQRVLTRSPGDKGMMTLLSPSPQHHLCMLYLHHLYIITCASPAHHHLR